MSIDKDLLDRLMEGRSPSDLFGKEGGTIRTDEGAGRTPG